MESVSIVIKCLQSHIMGALSTLHKSEMAAILNFESLYLLRGWYFRSQMYYRWVETWYQISAIPIRNDVIYKPGF